VICLQYFVMDMPSETRCEVHYLAIRQYKNHGRNRGIASLERILHRSSQFSATKIGVHAFDMLGLNALLALDS
jgi:hypothetical protein